MWAYSTKTAPDHWKKRQQLKEMLFATFTNLVHAWMLWFGDCCELSISAANLDLSARGLIWLWPVSAFWPRLCVDTINQRTDLSRSIAVFCVRTQPVFPVLVTRSETLLEFVRWMCEHPNNYWNWLLVFGSIQDNSACLFTIIYLAAIFALFKYGSSVDVRST